MLPPSFVAASRQQPQGVPMYSYPLTGASGEFYFRTRRFLLAAPGSFSRGTYTSFPPTARSLSTRKHRYSSLSKLSALCCCISASSRVITCPFSIVKDLPSHYYRVSKEKILLTMFRYIVWLKVTQRQEQDSLYLFSRRGKVAVLSSSNHG